MNKNKGLDLDEAYDDFIDKFNEETDGDELCVLLLESSAEDLEAEEEEEFRMEFQDALERTDPHLTHTKEVVRFGLKKMLADEMIVLSIAVDRADFGRLVNNENSDLEFNGTYGRPSASMQYSVDDLRDCERLSAPKVSVAVEHKNAYFTVNFTDDGNRDVVDVSISESGSNADKLDAFINERNRLRKERASAA